MDFNPGGNPKEELDKWKQEYLRLQSEWGKEDEIKQARKHIKYFSDLAATKLPHEPEKTFKSKESGESEPEKRDWAKRKAPPWPGWNKILSKL